MNSRLTSARLAIGAALWLSGLVPGCYLDHGLGDPGPDPVLPRDAATVMADVGPEPELGWDGGFGPDTSSHGAMCTLADRAVTVRIEPVTSEIGFCDVTHVDGMFVYEIVPAPEDDGIRVRADFCPARGADCRCDIVIGNVGTDVALSVLPGSVPLTLDLRPGSGPGTYVAIEEAPHCRCDGCACSLALVLYAADTTPEMAEHLPRELSFARGTEICPDLGCVSGTWNLAVRYPDATFDVPAGTTRVDGAIHVRAIRDEDIFAPCAACDGCATPHASWIAWAEN